MLSCSVPSARSCQVTVKDIAGITHTVTVTASSLFQAAATAPTVFRKESWAAEALTRNATLRVEVQMPAVLHEVPLKAVERWLRSPSASPREAAQKLDTQATRKR